MKHATLNKAILTILLFMLVTTVAHVNATTTTDDTTNGDDGTTTETGDDSSTSTPHDDLNNRDVTVDTSPALVEIKSELESGGTEDSFSIKVEVGSNGLEFKVEFETESTTNETERQFEVQLNELIEYLDVNGNDVYDNSVDTVLKTVELVSFESLVYTVENTADGPVHIIDVLTTDGVFGARAYAVGDFTEINGSIIAPTQLKIDVMIRGFNFTDASSQLAMRVGLGSELETSFDDSTEDEHAGRAVNESEMDVLLTDVTGFFSWMDSATIDGVTYPVNSSIHEVSASETEVFLSYPQGNEIIHDPKVGFENLLLAEGFQLPAILADNLLPISIGAAVVIIGIALFVKRR